MMWLVYAHAIIGLAVTITFLGAISAEVVRALRQALRVSAIAARCRRGRCRATWREYLYAVRKEFLSSYTSLRIGIYEIPRNPSEPIRRAYR